MRAETVHPSAAIRRSPPFLLGALAVGYLLLFIWLNGLSVHSLSLHKGIDQTYLLEGLTNTLDGRFFQHTHSITNLTGFGQMDHFFPILILFLPFIALSSDLSMLLAVHSLCLTAAGLVIFFIARGRLPSPWHAVLATAAFWTMPEIYYQHVLGTWPEIWSLPFLAAMFAFYFRRRLAGFSIAAILFMACMEQMFIFVPLFSVMELFRRRDWRWLAIPICLASGWAALIAASSVGATSGRFTVHRFDLNGSHLVEFVRSLLWPPIRSPLALLLPFCGWIWLFIAGPSFILIAWGMTLSPLNEDTFHYGAYLYLFFAIGGIWGLDRIATLLQRWRGWTPGTSISVILTGAIAVHLLTLLALIPRELDRYRSSPSERRFWRIVESLPGTARVATNREVSYALVDKASACQIIGLDYQIIDYFFDRSIVSHDVDRNHVDKLRWIARRQPFVVLYRNGGFRMKPVQAVYRQAFEISDIQLLDLNDDGWDDLLIRLPNQDEAVLYNDNGRIIDPGFSAEIAYELPNPMRQERFEQTFRLSRDTRVSIDSSRTHVIISRIDPKPALLAQLTIENGFIEDLHFSDLDGNGDYDLIVLDSETYRFWAVENQENRCFIVHGPFPAGGIPTAIDSADLDHDGDQDLAITKVNRVHSYPMLKRFWERERIDTVLWFKDPRQQELADAFERYPDWCVELKDNLLRLSNSYSEPPKDSRLILESLIDCQ